MTVHHILSQPPDRAGLHAGLADHAARHDRTRIRGAVRWKRCPLCGALAYGPCQVQPPGDHLTRWLAAYKAGKIAKAELCAAIAPLVIITADQVVPERAGPDPVEAARGLHSAAVVALAAYRRLTGQVTS